MVRNGTGDSGGGIVPVTSKSPPLDDTQLQAQVLDQPAAHHGIGFEVGQGVQQRLMTAAQKFSRVFGLTKLTFLLAFTIAGYNVACIRSFKVRKAADAEARDAKKKHRAKRRKGTYAEILGDSAEGPGPAHRQTENRHHTTRNTEGVISMT